MVSRFGSQGVKREEVHSPAGFLLLVSEFSITVAVPTIAAVPVHTMAADDTLNRMAGSTPGTNSHHKNGHYKNPKTADRYGQHKPN